MCDISVGRWNIHGRKFECNVMHVQLKNSKYPNAQLNPLREKQVGLSVIFGLFINIEGRRLRGARPATEYLHRLLLPGFEARQRPHSPVRGLLKPATCTVRHSHIHGGDTPSKEGFLLQPLNQTTPKGWSGIGSLPAGPSDH